MPSPTRFAPSSLEQDDISYGVYIYHMPVTNLLLFHGITGASGLLVTVAAAVVLATLPWRIVEKPALSLKRYSART